MRFEVWRFTNELFISYVYIENDMVYHPELKFQFPVPSGWQTQNSPAQFQMGPKDGKSAMILMPAPGNTLDEAAQALVKQLNLKVLENSRTTIDGNPALVFVSQQQPDQQQQGQQQTQQTQQTAANTLQIGTYLIQHNNAIYALHGLASAADFSNRFPTFKSVAERFRTLTNPDKLNRNQDRVFVKTPPPPLRHLPRGHDRPGYARQPPGRTKRTEQPKGRRARRTGRFDQDCGQVV